MGAAEQIAAVEQMRNALRLNRRGIAVALRRDCLLQLRHEISKRPARPAIVLRPFPLRLGMRLRTRFGFKAGFAGFKPRVGIPVIPGIPRFSIGGFGDTTSPARARRVFVYFHYFPGPACCKLSTRRTRGKERADFFGQRPCRPAGLQPESECIRKKEPKKRPAKTS